MLTAWRRGAFRSPSYQELARRRARAEQRAAVMHVILIAVLVAVGLFIIGCVASGILMLKKRVTTIHSDHGIFPMREMNRVVWLPDPDGGIIPKPVRVKYLINPNIAPGPVVGISPTGVNYPNVDELHPAQLQITRGGQAIQQQRAANEGAGFIDIQGAPESAPALIPAMTSRVPPDVEVLADGGHLAALIQEADLE